MLTVTPTKNPYRVTHRVLAFVVESDLRKYIRAEEDRNLHSEILDLQRTEEGHEKREREEATEITTILVWGNRTALSTSTMKICAYRALHMFLAGANISALE